MSYTVQQVQPILAVRDIAATLAYYTGTLGFTDSWTWGTPAAHAGASLGRAGLQFSLDPERAEKGAGAEFFFFVRDIAALHEKHLAANARIVSPLEVKPWLMREYKVADPDGYLLRFAEEHSAVPQRQGAREDVAIVDRAPTVEEYQRLIRAVGWEGYTDLSRAAEIIAGARFVAVAMDGERVVGAGMVLGDGVSFFYLKDIMIEPAYQQKGIGARLVGHLMARVEASGASKALVGLFTGANLAKFYEPFGFAGADRGLFGMTRRVGV